MLDKMMIVNKLIENTNAEEFINLNDLDEAINYSPERIKLLKKVISPNNEVSFSFRCETSNPNKPWYAVIEINKNKIQHAFCNCSRYDGKKCPHTFAIFLNYAQELFEFDATTLANNYGKFLIDKYAAKPTNKIKKEVQLKLSFNIRDNSSFFYERYILEYELLIGEKKLYKVGNKLKKLIECYKYEDDTLKFGKEFTYDPESHYFSKEAKTILEAIVEINQAVYLEHEEIKRFLERIKNSEFYYDNYKNQGIKNGFPLNSKLSKQENSYYLNFDRTNFYLIFDDDLEYIVYKGQLYQLNTNEQNLVNDICEFDEDIIFDEKDLDTFSNGILKIIKNNIELSENIDELKLAKKINTELYFDLRNSYIICEAKFKYDQDTIDYFDKQSKIVRDTDYEITVINDIMKYGFAFNKEKIVLTDIEKTVDFIENGLEELATHYVIFTTEKFKNINIKKKTNITSTFGIGQDNILSYGFDLGDINNDEIVNIFKEIKNKKRYYRLKNGDILNLEDENLQQLENLTEELELSDEEILQGKGSILKYRAIYLDSLKNTKYSIINTDNLFDNFIANFYKYKDAKLTLPKDDLKILRDYQLTGVKWLYNLAKTGFGGILADEMGLGKTIQTIYYIKQILKDDPNKKILIIVPTSLAYNWEKEFDQYGSEIKKAVIVGKKEYRESILKNLNDTSVLITTYGLLREDFELYKDLSFDTAIIDEAQNIKNNLAGITKCVKSIKADVKFALTGTPLENSVLELWSIFDFIMPGYLASLTKFQGRYRIKDYNEDTDKLIKGLSSQINPFILRRKKADVVKELPEKLINDIYIELDEQQKILYAAELENVKNKLAEAMENGGMSQARFIILTLLTKLRQLCIDPQILYENYDGKSNKIDTLVNVVNEYIANNHKLLIFSSFRTGLNVVKNALEKNKINSYMIDGSVSSKDRMNMVEDFNKNDDIKVFLIMLKSGGTGLNLTGADVVIHLDLWWNPQAENQATDRAHRIGQTKNVEVIHLIMKGTIEERILELQNKKRILSDKLIDGEIRDKNIVSELTEEDIKMLLAYENE